MFIVLGSFPTLVFLKENEVINDLSQLIDKYSTCKYYLDNSLFYCGGIRNDVINQNIINRLNTIEPLKTQ